MLSDRTCIEIVDENGSLKTLEEIEIEVIKLRIQQIPNLTKLAESLGMGRSTLYRKIQDFGLEEYIEQVREGRELEKIETERREREAISRALEQTSDWEELCILLNLDKKTLRQRMNYFGLVRLSEAQRDMRRRLRAERERFEAAGILSIVA